MAAEMDKRFAESDVCVMAAAVSDYRPAVSSAAKMHRSEKENITIELTPNPDILADLGAAKTSKQILVGFSLESGDDIDRAELKMRNKRCDMMVFNNADTAIGGDGTSVTLLFAAGGREAFPAMSKTEAAKLILGKVGGIVPKNL